MTDDTKNTDCGSIDRLLDERVPQGGCPSVEQVLRAARDAGWTVEPPGGMGCRSVADELAEAKRLIWKIRHICARPSGPSDLDRVMRLVDEYGATRSLESGEATEQESVAVPVVHARRLLDWLRWSGTDEWDPADPGPPEWRNAFLALERVVQATEEKSNGKGGEG